MNRRHLLAGAGGFIVTTAGCLGDGEPARDGENRDHDAETYEKKYFEVEPDDVPEENPLAHRVELPQTNARSPDNPLTLHVTIENTTDEVLVYGERRETFFIGSSDQDFLLIDPDADSRYEFDQAAGGWVATEEIDSPADFQTDDIDPGATHDNQAVLIAADANDNPRDIPDEFRFRTSFGAEPLGGETKPARGYDWAFSLIETE